MLSFLRGDLTYLAVARANYTTRQSETHLFWIKLGSVVWMKWIDLRDWTTKLRNKKKEICRLKLNNKCWNKTNWSGTKLWVPTRSPTAVLRRKEQSKLKLGRIHTGLGRCIEACTAALLSRQIWAIKIGPKERRSRRKVWISMIRASRRRESLSLWGVEEDPWSIRVLAWLAKWGERIKNKLDNQIWNSPATKQVPLPWLLTLLPQQFKVTTQQTNVVVQTYSRPTNRERPPKEIMISTRRTSVPLTLTSNPWKTLV